MPSAAEHHTWAQQNEAFYTHLGGSQSQYPDWAMTVIFYVALHEIEAALVAKGSRVYSHEQRKAKLASKWPVIRQWHDFLYTRSRDARYRCQSFSANDLALAETALASIRAEIAKLNLAPY